MMPTSSPPIHSHFSSLSTLSPSGVSVAASETLLCTASETHIAVYSLLDLKQVALFKNIVGSGAVKAVLFSTNGKLIFTAHQDRKIRIWSVDKAVKKSRNPVVAALPTCFDKFNHFMLPRNYVTVRRHHRCLWIKHADVVSAVAATPTHLYSSSWDKTIKIWKISTFSCIASIPAHHDAVNALTVSLDGLIYTASADTTIKVWAPHQSPKKSSLPSPKTTHIVQTTLEHHNCAVNALALTSNGAELYSGGGDRLIVVWRKDDRGVMKAVTTLIGHEKAVMCLSTVDDVLVSGSTDRTVRVWRRIAEGGECVGVMVGHRSGVRSVVACRVAGEDGGGRKEYRVCSGSVDGEVKVWTLWV